MHICRVVSRSSTLACVQSREAVDALRAKGLVTNSNWNFEYLDLKSTGDLRHDVSMLDGQAPADFFTREIDQALRDGRADVAVHSAKDLPQPIAADIEIIALLPARDQSDSLACRVGLPRTENLPLPVLPLHARVGTSSPARRDQLLALRPDLVIVSIRGSIEERLAQVDDGSVDALVVATCALERLGLMHRATEILSFETHPLQGHLAVVALRRRQDMRGLWAHLDVRQAWGGVSLVGAGPGDPELITIKARNVLAQADVIYYDALANSSMLPQNCELVFVGKRKGEHSASQDEINALLYRSAINGKRVVRLKGGDPFIFGRGGEEYRYLRERLVDVEVVPGISSAMAAAATTGMSLTDRSAAASLALCTGYPVERVQVPDADTRVYYMGTSNIGKIAQMHIEKGFSPDLRVALIHNASLPDQESRLSTIGQLASNPPSDLPMPMLVVVGDVVPADGLDAWWERRRRVWYTGTDPEALNRRSKRGRKLIQNNELLIHVPLIAIEAISNVESIARVFSTLKSYNWLIFTSRHTVAFFFENLSRKGLDTRALAGLCIAAVGSSTAAALADHGIRADLVPERESSRGLLDRFAEIQLSAITILIPGTDRPLPILAEGLSALGHTVERIPLYRTIPTEITPEIDLNDIDAIVLSSPSTVDALARHFPILPPTLELRTMGEETSAAVNRLWPGRTGDPT